MKIQVGKQKVVPGTSLGRFNPVLHGKRQPIDVSSGMRSMANVFDAASVMADRIGEERTKDLAEHNVLKLQQEINAKSQEYKEKPYEDGDFERWQKDVAGLYDTRKKPLDATNSNAAKVFDSAYQRLFTQEPARALTFINGKKLQSMATMVEEDVDISLKNARDASYDEKGEASFNAHLGAAKQRIMDEVGVLWDKPTADMKVEKLDLVAQEMRLSGMAAKDPHAALAYTKRMTHEICHRGVEMRYLFTIMLAQRYGWDQ